MFYVRRALRRIARWLLRNRSGKSTVGELIAIYKQDVNVITETLDSMLVESEVEEHNELAQAWMERGVEEKLAHQVARLSSLQSALDISSVASETGKTVEQASKLYFNLGDRLSLHWFLKQINSQAVDNNWQALARAAFREDLDWQQRQLTAQVLNCACANEDLDVMQALEEWMEANEQSLHRWESILNEFKVGSVHEFAKFSVALRELVLLNLNCSSTSR